MTALIISFTLLIAGQAYASDPNGSVEYIGDIRILNLWGSWEEMGYAHGYLLGPDIKSVFENYIIELAGGISTYNAARQLIQTYFDIPQEFQDYSAGLLTGAADTVNLYCEHLGRDMDQLDAYVVTCIPDVAALKGWNAPGCSSVSAWGASTQDEPALAGSPAISRNLDFRIDSAATILDVGVLITYDPDDGQEFVAISFAGYLGCLSGMNSSGVSATLNMGNSQGTIQYTPNFVPICMALALGLSEPDFNGSGSFDLEDMKDALTNWNMSNSYAIHLVGDRNLAEGDSCAAVVELNNRYGSAFRYTWDEPSIASNSMILTNHHRVLIPPVTCQRYKALLDSLTLSSDVTLDRLWDFMKTVGYPAAPSGEGTLQAMIFMPEQLRMGVAFATLSEPANEQDPQWIDWVDLFPNHPPEGIEEGTVPEVQFHIAPSPTRGIITVQFAGTASSLRVYDIQGRLMTSVFTQSGMNEYTADLSPLPAGIYRITGSINDAIMSSQVVLLR